MNIAESLLASAKKALQVWTDFVPSIVEYQKKYLYADLATLGYPGLTPEGITALLTEMSTGLEEYLPVLSADPWFGGTVQEIISDDKHGQFISALALDDTNQYGPFKAAVPKLKEIRAILIRNGYAWTLSPKLKENADGERAVQRAIQALKKQGKDAAEALSSAKKLNQETQAIFTTVGEHIESIRSAYNALTQQQVQLAEAASAIHNADSLAAQSLEAIRAKQTTSDSITQEIQNLGPQTISVLKAAHADVLNVTERTKQQRAVAETAALAATTAATDAEKAKALTQGALTEVTVAQTQAVAAKDETVSNRDAAKKAATEVEQLTKTLSEKTNEVEQLRTRAQEVVKNAENAWTLANRRGLAKAFDDAAKGYRNATIFYILLFSAAVGTVCWIELDKIIPLLAEGKLLDTKSLVLILLSGPILWGAWIASREISKSGQMRDEYRYKASVAMALEGYKREAGEVDPALVLKLMEGAVRHFAENPALRVHRANAPATPLHDALERLRGRNETKDIVLPESIVTSGIGPTSAPTTSPIPGAPASLQRPVAPAPMVPPQVVN